MRYGPTRREGRDTLSRLQARRDVSLTKRLILFSSFLKDHGFKVFSSSMLDSLKGLEVIDFSNREDFFYVLRANLVTTDAEWELFGELFEQFWQGIEDGESEEEEDTLEREEKDDGDLVPEFQLEMSHHQGPSGAPPEKEAMEAATYSPVSSLERKNLAQVDKKDIQYALLVLKSIISPFRISLTRRYKRSRRPEDLDFRRILKKSLKTEGIPFEIFYRKKRKRLKRLVVLADVSGSMDRYARFVMPFIMGLKGVGSKADLFVFSTTLTPLSSILRRFTFDGALEKISREVTDWSGGTRIGYSLHQFNQRYGERLINKRTIVVIMSDGWDLGGRELLKREMEILSIGAHSVIWLNPLAGDPEYRPICQGMQTSLPYIDYFLPADSLQSLKKVGRTLTKVMSH
ncbi:MAG: VWA domain-containing protein [Pseudomonadota bacterium]